MYPLLLSILFRATDLDARGQFAAIVFNGVLAALTYAFLPLVAAKAGLPVIVGLSAGLIGALVPMRLLTELGLTAGGVQLRALCWILLHLLTFLWYRESPVPAARWLAYGVCWGLAFHADPALLPVYLVWLAILASRQPRPANAIVLAVVGSVLALLPWTLRNRSELGGWFFVRSNLGMELALSFNDLAHAIIAYEIVPHDARRFRHWMDLHPIGSEYQRARIRAMGELAYDRARLQEAWDWIRRNPKRTASLIVERVRYFWFYPGMTRPWRKLLLYPMVAVAVLGLVLMRRHHRLAALLFLADCLAYPLTYYVIQVSGRYRYPMEWIILFLCCYAAWEAGQALQRHRSDQLSMPRPPC
ncbi:MAG: hypothetical protein RMK57_12735 [Bryobacterales bacterium]|nr:hypothetical protein [Bryobacteraceae bacterium]MDW8355383.1 hypothetical protein [Bryobacterales bacterium]